MNLAIASVTVDECYDTDIFTAAQAGNDFSKATDKLKKNVPGSSFKRSQPQVTPTVLGTIL